jgi:hypothetical protein
MKFKLLMVALMGMFIISSCSSNQANAEGMKCCKEAAAKGEKCEKCNHDEEGNMDSETSSDVESDETTSVKEAKECCATAKAEGKDCDKCSPKKACCEEAVAEGKECSKCSQS